MPTGLKTTSSPLQISSFIATTAPAGDLFVTKQIDLQLNPLDNEVFVVTGLKIDFANASQEPRVTPEGVFEISQKCSVSKTALTGYRGIDSNTVVGASEISTFLQVNGSVASPPILVQQYSSLETNSMDAPPATQDYLDIIATNDYHLNLFVTEGYNLGTDIRANVRLYGYRATASSSVYAALVQSEMLSS